MQAKFKSGFIAVTGLPNAGKSTLINEIVGRKLSIVSPKPQTTRDNIIAISEGDGYQAVFTDTPGYLIPKYGLQKIMVAAIRRAAFDEADMVCLVVEPFVPGKRDIALAQELSKSPVPVYLVINKTDLAKSRELLTEVEEAYSKLLKIEKTFRVSAKTGANVKSLKNELIAHLPEHPAYFEKGNLSNRWSRFFVSELIREEIFHLFEDELPYSTAVEIEYYREYDDIPYDIQGIIHVERNAHKPIVIGKGGKKIRELRENSQKNIEEFLEHAVKLHLIVKVSPNWRNENSSLKQFGYASEK